MSKKKFIVRARFVVEGWIHVMAEDEEAALEKGQEHAEMHGSPGFHLDGEEIDSVEVEGFAQ